MSIFGSVASGWCVATGGHTFTVIRGKVVCTYCGKVAK